MVEAEEVWLLEDGAVVGDMTGDAGVVCGILSRADGGMWGASRHRGGITSDVEVDPSLPFRASVPTE